MPGQPGIVYVLGSVHIGREDAVLDAAVARAVIEADHLVFELDPDEDLGPAMALTRQEGFFPPGESLQQALSPEVYARLQKVLAERKIVIPMVDRMKPWLVGVTLSAEAARQSGLAAERGIDYMVEVLGRREPSRQRSLQGLETATDQVRALLGIGEMMGDAVMGQILLELEATSGDAIVQAYIDGDETAVVRTIRQMHQEAKGTDAAEAMIDRRNRVMVEGTLPFFERPGKTVVTVGAAHVLGDEGMVALLEAEGAELDRVPREGPAGPRVAALLAPRDETYHADEVGLEMLRRGKVSFASQRPPIPGASLHIYVQNPSRLATLTVMVMKMPLGMRIPGFARSFAESTLETMGATETLRSEETRLAGAPGTYLEGRGDRMRIRAWSAAVGGRILVVVESKPNEPDPEGEALSDRIVESLRFVEG